MSKLTTVPFHGASLIAIAGDRPETTLVAMKPIVEGIGLSWPPQHRKMLGHHLFSTCVTNLITQMPGDDQAREHVFLPLNRLPMWLVTIQPSKVPNEETRVRVIEYQTEAADVLFRHFFGTAFVNPNDTILRDIDSADLNAKVGMSRHAMRLWGRSAGVWAWQASGLPMPPRHLLTHGQQMVLDVVSGRSVGEAA